MRALAYYNRGTGWEKAAEMDADDKNDVFNACQLESEDGPDVERSMIPWDIVALGDRAWFVNRIGYTEIDSVDSLGDDSLAGEDVDVQTKNPIDHDRELGVV